MVPAWFDLNVLVFAEKGFHKFFSPTLSVLDLRYDLTANLISKMTIGAFMLHDSSRPTHYSVSFSVRSQHKFLSFYVASNDPSSILDFHDER